MLTYVDLAAWLGFQVCQQATITMSENVERFALQLESDRSQSSCNNRHRLASAALAAAETTKKLKRMTTEELEQHVEVNGSGIIDGFMEEARKTELEKMLDEDDDDADDGADSVSTDPEMPALMDPPAGNADDDKEDVWRVRPEIRLQIMKEAQRSRVLQMAVAKSKGLMTAVHVLGDWRSI